MIFVSHKESDADVAGALVQFLRSCIDIPENKIRCTSVPGYQLPFGTTVSGQLKKDLDSSNAVFVLLTSASLQSPWVLFELGASWALGKVIVPILGAGVSLSDLPGPLKEYQAIRADDTNAAARLRDAITQVSQELEINEKGGGGAQKALDTLLDVLRSWKPDVQPAVTHAQAFQLGFQLINLLSNESNEYSPTVAFSEIEALARDLGLSLPSTWREDVRGQHRDHELRGQATMNLARELGGQFKVRHPKAVPYFEAGVNLIIGASREGKLGVSKAVENLGLPEAIKEPKDDAVVWVNQIHGYFEDVLR